jgi:hypothetical protein
MPRVPDVVGGLTAAPGIGIGCSVAPAGAACALGTARAAQPAMAITPTSPRSFLLERLYMRSTLEYLGDLRPQSWITERFTGDGQQLGRTCSLRRSRQDESFRPRNSSWSGSMRRQ